MDAFGEIVLELTSRSYESGIVIIVLDGDDAVEEAYTWALLCPLAMRTT